MIEILAIMLKPGTRNTFHQLYITESLPLQKKWTIEVIEHGPSWHDEDSYYVIRSFQSIEERQRKEDAFYDSNDWQKGPRTALLGMIDSIVTVVVPAETLQGWLGAIKR